MIGCSFPREKDETVTLRSTALKHSTTALVLALLAAGLGGIPALGVGYLSDDWAIISYLNRHGNGDAWMGSWLGLETLKFHRPVFTGLYAAELSLFGADPFPAHIHHLLWHVLATGLAFKIVRLLGSGVGGAFFGAIVFAIHPLLPGATGWLAGRCGSVAGALTLLTVFAHLMFREPGARRRAAWLALGLAGAATAALTRESGYLALIAPLTIDLVRERPRPRLTALARVHGLYAAAGVALLALRHRALGTLGGGYPEPDGLMAGPEHFRATLELTGEALLRLMGALAPEFAGNRLLLPIAIGCATAVILIAGLVRGSRRNPVIRLSALVLMLLIIEQLAFLVLTGPILMPATGQRWYAAIAAFSALLGLAAEPLLERSRLWAPLLLVPALLAGHYLVQRELLAADAEVRKVTTAVLTLMDEEAARRATWRPPQALGPVIISCLSDSRIGHPTFQWGFAESLRPPFQDREPPGVVYPVHRFMYLGRELAYPLHPPLEALLHVQGIIPLAIGVVDPWRTFDDRMQIANVAGVVDSLGPSPPKWPMFAGEAMRVLEPRQPRKPQIVRHDSFEVRLRVDAHDADAIEFFTFMPTVDRRDKVFVNDRREIEIDLSRRIKDFVVFRNEPMAIYVIPVGYRPASPDRPILGPLVTFQYQP